MKLKTYTSLPLVLALITASGVWAVQDAAPDPAIKDAQKTSQVRLEQGIKLLALLENPKTSPVDRHDAATVLGDLQFLPAISALVREIDFLDPTRRAVHPCLGALIQMEHAGTVAAVEAYVVETKDARKRLFILVILYSKTKAAAKTYAQGLLVTTKDKQHRSALISLLKQLNT